MGQLPLLVLRRANPGDFDAVRSLLREAAQWLGTKNTDQWAVPWPDEDGRNTNINRAIRAGRTWIVVTDQAQPAATLTTSPNHHGIWPDADGREPAVYVRRITVSRRFAGQGLGSQLLDWAGLRANSEYGARWVRVDVWTTNEKLHEYYKAQGFKERGRCPIPDYPSAVLFQKSVDRIKFPAAPLFREDPLDRLDQPLPAGGNRHTRCDGDRESHGREPARYDRQLPDPSCRGGRHASHPRPDR